ncbi:hypothetical protein EST38_g7847 [Candolleomyces aberdarensis]|uniref:Uncharacterized protein n=1 Tax=Candolleomyces aberdarensis TaxID=2316362 RepID=A0A4V1Q3B5_9AGAR|nr:hypothetical protein EST38_g7847 [Candolleomyces aberdarensis]
MTDLNQLLGSITLTQLLQMLREMGILVSSPYEQMLSEEQAASSGQLDLSSRTSLLALPAIYSTWSLILFVCCIMAFVWRTGPDITSESTASPGDVHMIILRGAVSGILAMGCIHAVLIMTTFRQYGQEMDRVWRQRINRWIDERTDSPLILGSGDNPYTSTSQSTPRQSSTHVLRQTSSVGEESGDPTHAIGSTPPPAVNGTTTISTIPLRGDTDSLEDMRQHQAEGPPGGSESTARSGRIPTQATPDGGGSLSGIEKTDTNEGDNSAILTTESPGIIDNDNKRDLKFRDTASYLDIHTGLRLQLVSL